MKLTIASPKELAYFVDALTANLNSHTGRLYNDMYDMCHVNHNRLEGFEANLAKAELALAQLKDMLPLFKEHVVPTLRVLDPPRGGAAPMMAAAEALLADDQDFDDGV